MPTNKTSGKLLIFDFDNTMVKGHLHRQLNKLSIADYNISSQNSVKKEYLDSFAKGENTGVLNKDKLTSVLQSAFDKGVDVTIASFTKFPNAVEYIKDNHLGLTKDQARQINVIGDFPEKYNKVNAFHTGKGSQQGKIVGKNFHVVECIKQYYKRHGNLPQSIELVDDSKENIDHFNNFYEEILKYNEWFKEYTGLDVAKLKNIEFKGVNVPKKANIDNQYLNEVTNFVRDNSSHSAEDISNKNIEKKRNFSMDMNKINIPLKRYLDLATNFVGRQNAGIVKQYLIEAISNTNSDLSTDYNKGQSYVIVATADEVAFSENFKQSCQVFSQKIVNTLQELVDQGKVSKNSSNKDIYLLLCKELPANLTEQKVQQKKSFFGKVKDFFLNIMSEVKDFFFEINSNDKVVNQYSDNHPTKIESKNDKTQVKKQNVTKEKLQGKKTTSFKLKKKISQENADLKKNSTKKSSDFIYEERINLSDCVKEASDVKKLSKKANIVGKLVAEAIENSCQNVKVKIDKNLITVCSNKKSDTPRDLQARSMNLANQIVSILQNLEVKGRLQQKMKENDIKKIVKTELGELKLPGVKQSEIKSDSMFKNLPRENLWIENNQPLHSRDSKSLLSPKIDNQASNKKVQSTNKIKTAPQPKSVSITHESYLKRYSDESHGSSRGGQSI